MTTNTRVMPLLPALLRSTLRIRSGGGGKGPVNAGILAIGVGRKIRQNLNHDADCDCRDTLAPSAAKQAGNGVGRNRILTLQR
jgi:hypothetical protein